MAYTVQCCACGAKVRVRRSKRGRAYVLCNGELEGGCGTRTVYGVRHSAGLLAALEAAGGGRAGRRQPEPEPEPEPGGRKCAIPSPGELERDSDPWGLLW